MKFWVDANVYNNNLVDTDVLLLQSVASSLKSATAVAAYVSGLLSKSDRKKTTQTLATAITKCHLICG